MKTLEVKKKDKGALVLLGLGGLAALLFLGKKSSSGTLSVSSTPSGATVTVGSFSGITPWTKTLIPGPYSVNISLTGYQNWSQTVTIVTNEITSISANLTPVAAGDIVYDVEVTI